MNKMYFSFQYALILSATSLFSITSAFAMDITTDVDRDITMMLKPIKPIFSSEPSEEEIQKEFKAKKEAMERANKHVNKRLKLGPYARTPHIQK